MPPQSYTTITRGCNKKNIVYWPNWAASSNKFPSQLPGSKISHIIYAFAAVNSNGNATLSDPYADLQQTVDGVNGTIAALQQLKTRYPHLKILLSVGGGGPNGDNFPRVAATAATRAQFVASLYELVRNLGFDGIDIDWEYPLSAQDGANYLSLLQGLRQSLPAPRYSLTTALPAGSWALQYIDLKSISATLDWISIMAYDFYGPWEPVFGNQAQLYAPKDPATPSQTMSGDSAIQYYANKGVPKGKLVLGAPLYGRSWNGTAGNDGVYPWAELPRPRSVECFDQETVSAYCVTRTGEWVTYDNPSSAKIKGQYVSNNGLAGMMWWSGNLDKVSQSLSLITTSFAAMNPYCTR